jgi:exonuclease VII large subunit
METSLDTRKSIIISSPAGSGKTERLARRYISLLKNTPKKGYSITLKNGKVVKCKSDINSGDELVTLIQDGTILSVVKN